MNTPSFYDESKIGQLYLPDTQGAAQFGANAGLAAAETDKQKVLLVNVDFQIDFVHADGSLSVPGAVDDVTRVTKWIYENLGQITTIASSLDSHLPFQIFYPLWWADENGNHPDPYTLITLADVLSGKWRPLISPSWSHKYLKALDDGGKKQLMIWPYHCMIGTPGQALVPALSEAILAHSAARHTQPIYLIKGSVAETENYSIVEPEVKVPSKVGGGLNTQFLDLVAKHDLVYIAGEAKSHCVLDTMHSIVNYFAAQPDVLAKIRFLEDCTSSVFHPDVDFDALANADLAKMAQLGIRLVRSTDPIS